MSEQISYVLIYTCAAGETLPFPAGIWSGSYPRRDDEESIGLRIRQGLAGFNVRATWQDLAEQLESAGFRRASVSVDEVMRIGKDVVRIVFLPEGMISYQWLTQGPDDNVRAANLPIGVFPSPSSEDN